jgi:hypothetical protein
VRAIWAQAIITRRGELLAVPPDANTNESLINTPPCLIPPMGKTIVFHCDINTYDKTPGGIGDGIDKGFVYLRFYGRIIYDDILQVNIATHHETKWLYWYISSDKEGAVPFPDPFQPQHNTYS